MEYQSNTDLFEAIEDLQSSLSSTGIDGANELLAEGMSSLNGLTDGWALLLESINSANEKYGETFSQKQSAELHKIHNAVHKMVHRG